MSTNVNLVPLGELLTRRLEVMDIEALEVYKRVTIRMYGGGVSVRDTPIGAEVNTKRQFYIRNGQFLLSKIDARNGAFGIVPFECDGAIITGNFWTFDVNHNRLNIDYLNYLTKTQLFIDFCIRASEGTTNRKYLSQELFLSQGIPLPPLDDQRRIVAHIEALAARIAEARGLRQQAVGEVEALLESYTDKVFIELTSSFELCKFSKICTTITDGDHITPQFSTEGVKFIFVGNVSSGHLHFNNCKYVTEEYFARIKPQRIPKHGDILYSAVGATLGVPAIVNVDEPFCFQRHIAILKPDPNRLDSQFAWHLLQSGKVYRKAWSSTTGSAQPTIPLKAIRELEIPVPPIQEQRRIVTYLDDLHARVDALKRLQAETAAEMDALLPAVLDRAFRGELV